MAYSDYHSGKAQAYQAITRINKKSITKVPLPADYRWLTKLVSGGLPVAYQFGKPVVSLVRVVCKAF